MAAADLLVHNAGGLSLTEALVAGLPAVTYLPIPGHGRANAVVLDRAGVAGWPRDPQQLADTIERLSSTAPRPLPMPAWPAGADPAVSLQVLALALGPIIVVQSVMTSSIVFTTVAEGLLTGRRPRGGTWSGVGLTGLGLVGLLVALRPTAGTGAVPPGGSTLAVAAGCLVLMLAAVTWSRTAAAPGSGAGRVLALAVATGLGYGITAVALKTVGTQLAAGLAGPLQHPALYVALALGPSAILLSQAALQQGRLATAVVSVILVVDPLVGLVGGCSGSARRSTSAPTPWCVRSCCSPESSSPTMTDQESQERAGHERDRDDGRGGDRPRVEHGRGGGPARRGEANTAVSNGSTRSYAHDPAHQRLLLLQHHPVRHRRRAARAGPLQRRADQRRARPDQRR